MLELRSTDDIKKLGTILSVWAHPDDETFTAAGIMMAAIENGQTVACITATKGEVGVQNSEKWSAETLGSVRARELRAALKIIGVSNHHWLGYKDGECMNVPDIEAVEKVKQYIEKYQPDTILTFGPEGMTGHLDHKCISRWVSQAVVMSGSKATVYHVAVTNEQYDRYLRDLDKIINIFYNIKAPPLCALRDCELSFVMSPELCRRKCDALAAMPSQTEKMFEHYDRATLDSWLNEEVFKRAV